MLSITGFTKDFGRLALLFTAVPILILAIVGTHTQGRFVHRYETLRLKELEKKLDGCVAGVAQNSFLLQRAYGLQRKASGFISNPLEFTQLHSNLEKATKMTIRAYLFQHGKLIASFSPHPTQSALMEKFFSLLSKEGTAFDTAQRESQSGLMTLFGPGSRLELLARLPGILRSYNNGGEVGAYYWNRFGKDMGIFITFSKIPSSLSRFKLYRVNGPDYCGAADPSRQEWIPPYGTTSDQMEIAWRQVQLTGKTNTSFAGYDWVFSQNKRGFILCVSSPRPTGNATPFISALITGGYFFSIVLLLLFLAAEWEFKWGTIVVDRLESRTIRFRLIAIFVMATMLPLGLALIIESVALSDREEVLADQAVRESLERLHTIEKSYSSRIESLKRLCHKLRNSNLVKNGYSSNLASVARRLQANESIQHLEIRDPLGKIIFSTYDPAVHGVTRAMDVFSKIAIRRHAGQRMGSKIDRITPEELLSESVMGTDEVGMATLLREPGHLWTFKMGTRPSLWFWDVYPGSGTKAAFIAIVHQMDFIYKHQLLQDLTAPKAGIPLQVGFELGPDGGSLLPIPRFSAPGVGSLIKAALHCQESGKILSRELKIGDASYWVTMKPEVEVGMYVLADLSPIAKQVATLSPIRWRLNVTAVLAILVAFLGATLLARLFILPIGDIGEGIAAISRRDSTFRIPIRRNDEFGKVAEAFNFLLEEMKELQYGRIVQESLLPATSRAPDGYTAACYRRTANDLAGDYHDIVELKNGQWAYILGDVTGHGISAALAMAMAKATVDYQGLAGWSFPTQVLDHLNALFNRELKPRNKFMTLGCLLLNPVNHHIVAENAGHPYPLVYRAATKTIEELPIPSMPLGARKKRPICSQSTILEEGDAVLLYSDGFIECTNPRGKMFGYPRFMALFRDLLAKEIPAEEMIRALGKALEDFRAPGPYPDDVTLVLLQRYNIREKV